MKRLAIAALLLWVCTIAAAGYFFVFGITATSPDGRQAVVLAAAERDHVLSEMRGLLQALAAISDALVRGDTGAVAAAAGAVGSGGLRGESPALLAKLPLDFKNSGMRIHAGFDDIEREAKAAAPLEKIARLAADQMSRCVACHASFRFAR